MMTIPGYTLTDPVCQTGDLVLYRASRMRDGLSVLLKVPVADRPTPLLASRLEREYELALDLDSSRIAHPLALERHAGTVVLVLEPGPTRSLASLLGAPMDVQSFLQIAIGIAAALTELHRHELVHKDIKPEHVLLDATGHVWLTGLGIASRLPREHQAPAPPETIAGTLAYMAPEQTGRMNRSIDSRSDLYALGATFYQMLTGVLPFTASDPMEWVHCHIARQPVPPNQRIGDLPEILSEMAMKLMAKTAEDRYQSAAGLDADLRRCLAQWESDGRIDRFPLGEHDVPDRLLIPEKLYGRKPEIDALLAAFDRVIASGMPEIVLVSGYSGIGKTSVVHEIHKALVSPRGLFAAGKFDQFKRDIPYATLVQALQSLIRQILGKSEPEVAAWREALQQAVSPNGQLIVGLIPEVELIIGPQPPVPELPPQEARNRFQRALLRFLGAFAAPEHPLALFLDDLQWLDAATLDLIEQLATGQDVRHLLLIGAYRDNEVGPTHPLMRIVEAIRKRGAGMREIVLAPLTIDDLGSLVADSLRCDRQHALPLAQLVHEKTGGNPFFATQFLTTLAEEKLLALKPGAARWTWDLARIRAKGYTDNVVDLMIGKLGRLPAATLEALEQLACLGNVADIATLTTVYGQSEEALHAALWEAVRTGLILRHEKTYAFLHDRMQEAAYALVPETRRKELHLKIGRLLFAQYPQEASAERVFDVVDQFNRSVELVTDAEERATLRRLNTAAGRKARGAVAYASARRYLEEAMALLPPDSWTDCYAESLALFRELAECEYLVGNFQRSDELLTAALEKARTTLDLASIHRLRLRLYQLSGRYREALDVALVALRLFGLMFPTVDKDIQVAAEAEQRSITDHLRGRRIMDLCDIPFADDVETLALIGLLDGALPLIYLVSPGLLALFTAKAVNICLQRGHGNESSTIYNYYALTLAGDIRNISTAQEFSEMSIELNARTPGAGPMRGKIVLNHAILINLWRHPIATSLPMLEQAFRACLDVGDLVYGGYATMQAIWLHLENGDPLERVVELAQRYVAWAQESHNSVTFHMDRLRQQFALALQGKTRSLTDFSDAVFDEANSVKVLAQTNFQLGVAAHHITKQIATFIAEQYDEALEWANRTAPMLLYLRGFEQEATYHFYHALTLAALHAQASAEQQREYAQTITEILEKLKLWADNCPENFANRYFLVSAEIARIEGRDIEAMRLYDQAIRSSRDNNFVHHEALAAEVASRFYRARGFDRIADAYLRDAHACYARWGAEGKVRQLEQRYPQLREAEPAAPSATSSTLLQNIDILAVVRASQAVSGEMVLDKLLETLMRIVLENAGAQKGYLLLMRNGDLSLAGEARVENQNVAMNVRGDPGFPDAVLPASILNYVRRSGDRVLLDDAASPNPYSADEYFSRQHPKSVLCFPIAKQTRLIGLLYLENDLATRAFTPDRLAVLELLAAQAAISLENALVYETLRASERRYRQSQDIGHVGNWEYNIQTSQFWGSDEAKRIYGFDSELSVFSLEEVKRCIPERERVHQALVDLIEKGTPYNLEHEIHPRDSSGSRVVASIADVQRDERGNPLAIQGVLLDITERKRAEEEILKLNRELEQRVAERTAQLEAANQAKSTFLANMSHELRTPLNAILGFSSMMRRNPQLSENQAESLDIINRSGEHLLALINDVLEMAKIEAGRVKLEIAPFDLVGMVRDLADMMRLRAKEKGLQLLVDQSSEFPRYIRGDEARLRQILVNLVGNAIKFTKEGSVTIRLGMKQNRRQHLLIEVEDTGPGIGAEDQQRIFQPFVQLVEDAEQKGTGLGLAITRQFVELMGGSIAVESTLGKGSLFRVELPVELVGAGDIPAAMREEAREILGLAPGQAARRILIAEDQPDNQMLLTQLMNGLGLETKVAENGEQCVQLFQDWHPDLIWMDRRMPVMDGTEATRRIRQLPGGEAVKIVAVTASAFKEQQQEMLAAGMDDFVSKPYRFGEIYDSLSRQLGLKYIYRADASKAQVAPVALTPAMMAGLPAALRQELREALERLDSERIAALIEQVAAIDAQLGSALFQLADRYDYGTMLRLVDEAGI